MAKYQAKPFYGVKSGDIEIKFNYQGEYVTDDKKEIDVLNALCPTWLTCVEAPKAEAKPKASAKASEK